MLLCQQDRQPLPLATLKTESCPQISAHDLITMCRLETHNLPRDVGVAEPGSSLLFNRNLLKNKKRVRPKAFVVDIRSTEEFRLGHVPGSVNISCDGSALQPDGSLVQTPATQKLKSVPRGRVVCVVGNKGEAAPIVSGEGGEGCGGEQVGGG
jgi:rhodanese-related sulfurtransferase